MQISTLGELVTINDISKYHEHYVSHLLVNQVSQISLQEKCRILMEIVMEFYVNCDGKFSIVMKFVTETTPSKYPWSQFLP